MGSSGDEVTEWWGRNQLRSSGRQVAVSLGSPKQMGQFGLRSYGRIAVGEEWEKGGIYGVIGRWDS